VTDGLTKRDQPDRSKINMDEDYEVHYWTKHLKISKEELQKAIDKVGNSAAAVRKELQWTEGMGHTLDLWSEAHTLFNRGLRRTTARQ
jgi:hypothetical protein